MFVFLHPKQVRRYLKKVMSVSGQNCSIIVGLNNNLHQTETLIRFGKTPKLFTQKHRLIPNTNHLQHSTNFLVSTCTKNCHLFQKQPMMMTIIASSSTIPSQRGVRRPLAPSSPSRPPLAHRPWGRMDTPARRPPHSSPSTPAISHTSRRRDSGRQRPPASPSLLGGGRFMSPTRTDLFVVVRRAAEFLWS